jgi:hypothetical protein
MNVSGTVNQQDEFLQRLLQVADRIATEGDLQAIQPLLDMTSAHSQSPIVTALGRELCSHGGQTGGA